MNKWGFIGFWISILTAIAVAALWLYVVCKGTALEFNAPSELLITLLGCLVTFSVGWQIYSVLELKSKQENLESKILVIENLSEELEKLKTEVQHNAEKAKRNMLLSILYSSLNEKDSVSPFVNKLIILQFDLVTLQFNNEVSKDLSDMKKFANAMKPCTKILDNADEQLIQDCDIKIKACEAYPTIKEHYERIMTTFFKNVASRENLLKQK